MTTFKTANELLNMGEGEEAARIYRSLIALDPKFRPYSFNAEIAEGMAEGRRPHSYDVIIATDLTFPGGSSSSTLEEIHVNSRSGLKTGLFHLPSPVMKRNRDFHAGLMQAVREGECYLIDPGTPNLECDVLIFRHPSVLHVTNPDLPDVTAQNVLIVVNHPPANAKGRIDYVLTQARIRASHEYKVDPKVYPIGPLIRARVEEYYGDAVPLQKDDWLNVFDVKRFAVNDRQSPRGRLRVGRHSRPGPEKWPADPETLLNVYPEDGSVDCHVLGGAAVPERILGYKPRNWTVYEFGAKPPEDFLREIDVFSYYHHPAWLEAFGRVLVEAMAAGLPLVVPPHFEPLLKDAALYREADEVRGAYEALKDPEVFMDYSSRSRSAAEARFGHEAHLDRLRPMLQREVHA